MGFDMGETVGPLAHWLGPWAVGAVAGWLLWLRMRTRVEVRRRESRLQQERQAYAELDVRLGTQGDISEVAGRVSRVIAETSAFRRAAVMLRDAEGRLAVRGSAGMDAAAVRLLDAWGDSVTAEERGCGSTVRRGDGGLGARVGRGSFAVILGRNGAEDGGEDTADVGYRRAVVIPLWTTSGPGGGQMSGALVVGADGWREAPRSVLRDALAPLEALAVKVARSVEDAALAERLMRAEKLARVGLLAGGMAHALNNPLTAVLGLVLPYIW